MSMFNKPQAPKQDFELTPAGMHPAVCYGIVDLGTHTDTFQGVTTNKHKIRIMWELDTDPKMADGRPFAIGKDYTISAGKWGPYIAKTSGLFSLLKGWMGWGEKECRLGNLAQVIGKPALIQVTHAPFKDDPTKFRAVMANVTPLMKGMKAPKQVNPSIMFELGKSLSEPGAGFDQLPEWMQSKILSCLEFNGGVPTKAYPEDTPSPAVDSDVPF